MSIPTFTDIIRTQIQYFRQIEQDILAAIANMDEGDLSMARLRLCELTTLTDKLYHHLEVLVSTDEASYTLPPALR